MKHTGRDRSISTALALFAMGACALVPACDSTAKSVRVNERSNKYAGVWQGKAPLVGGQGAAEVKVELKRDGSFVMEVGVGEKAHFLNAYPTFDQIKVSGKWSVGDGNGIAMDGEIEGFVRQQMIGDAGAHGFLPDDRKGIIETNFVPLPIDNKPTLRTGENGSLYLDSVEFRGRKADESDGSHSSRMIGYVPLERVED